LGGCNRKITRWNHLSLYLRPRTNSHHCQFRIYKHCFQRYFFVLRNVLKTEWYFPHHQAQRTGRKFWALTFYFWSENYLRYLIKHWKEKSQFFVRQLVWFLVQLIFQIDLQTHHLRCRTHNSDSHLLSFQGYWIARLRVCYFWILLFWFFFLLRFTFFIWFIIAIIANIFSGHFIFLWISLTA
jgi:hypothetical protein